MEGRHAPTTAKACRTHPRLGRSAMPSFGRASTGVVGAVVAASILIGTVIAATVIGATFIVLLTLKSAATQTAPRVVMAIAAGSAAAPAKHRTPRLPNPDGTP